MEVWQNGAIKPIIMSSGFDADIHDKKPCLRQYPLVVNGKTTRITTDDNEAAMQGAGHAPSGTTWGSVSCTIDIAIQWTENMSGQFGAQSTGVRA